jgi:hypothetical protein
VITRQDDSGPGAVSEIEREASYGGAPLPQNRPVIRDHHGPDRTRLAACLGKLKVIFSKDPGRRFRRLGYQEGKKSSARGGSMMRDLEVIPD